MTGRTKVLLKSYFNAGDSPTESNFADFIDTIGINGLLVAASNSPDAVKGRADYICDGVADEVQINGAIFDANAAGGGVVLLSPGFFNAAASIDLLNNVDLKGAGYSTIINIPGAWGLKVYEKYNITISNLRVYASANTTYGIEIGNSGNITIDHICVEEASNFALFIYAQPGHTTERIRVINSYFQQTNGVQDTIGGGKTATDVTAIFKDIIIENCFIYKDMTHGGANYNAFDMVAVSGISFINNICYGYTVTGTEQDYNYQSQFSGNIIHPAIGDANTKFVIDMQTTGTQTEGIIISNNIVDQGYLKINGAAGHITRRCIISDNIVYSTNLVNGIWINQTDAVIITGNMCIGTSTAGKYGILIQTSINVICNNNYVNGYDNDIFDNTVDPSNLISDNIAINFLSASVIASGSSPNNMGANPEKSYAQGNIAGATTFDRVHGDIITATLTNNVVATILAPPGSRLGDRLSLVLTQDGAGGRTMGWPANFKKAGGALVLSVGIGAVDVINMEYDGTNWRETSRALNQS